MRSKYAIDEAKGAIAARSSYNTSMAESDKECSRSQESFSSSDTSDSGRTWRGGAYRHRPIELTPP